MDKKRCKESRRGFCLDTLEWAVEEIIKEINIGDFSEIYLKSERCCLTYCSVLISARIKREIKINEVYNGVAIPGNAAVFDLESYCELYIKNHSSS